MLSQTPEGNGSGATNGQQEEPKGERVVHVKAVRLSEFTLNLMDFLLIILTAYPESTTKKAEDGVLDEAVEVEVTRLRLGNTQYQALGLGLGSREWVGILRRNSLRYWRVSYHAG